MDFLEMTGSKDGDSEQRETLKMITGAGDSTIKLWSDSTLEESVKE